jgi:MoaA/NifB/PqqE/SkfB family radical SAM enzyme
VKYLLRRKEIKVDVKNMNRIKFPGKFLRWEITSKCSLRCKHCYLGNETWRMKDLKLEKIKEILEKLKVFLPLKILFLGGEPFERNDIIEILSIAKKMGFDVGVDTSGRFLTKEKIKRLGKIGGIKINFSLYGFSPIVNDKFTYSGHFKDVIAAIENCKKENIDVDISFLLTKKNFMELFKINTFLKKYNIRNAHLDVFMNFGYNQIKNEFELTFSQFFLFWFFLRFFPSFYSKKIGQRKFSVMVSPCERSRVPTIKPNGDVWPCMFVKKSVGNITNDNFDEIWKRISNYKFKAHDCIPCIKSKLPKVFREILPNLITYKLYRIYVSFLEKRSYLNQKLKIEEGEKY